MLSLGIDMLTWHTPLKGRGVLPRLCMLHQDSKGWEGHLTKFSLNNPINYSYTDRINHLKINMFIGSTDGTDFPPIEAVNITENSMTVHVSILLTPAAIFRMRERKNDGAHH